MAAPQAHGSLVISVDLELDAERRGRIDSSSLEMVAGQLQDIFRRHGVPATWGVADPCHSAASEAILQAGAGHEIAVLGDSTWVGAAAGRVRFARELSRRVEGARSAGITVTSLLLRNVRLTDHFDLFIRHGLTALRGGITPDCQTAHGDPQCIRFGLWEVPHALVLPGQSRIMPGGGGGWRARRLVRDAMHSGRICHLVIDASRLAETRGRGLGTIESLVRLAARRASENRLSLLTLRGAVAQLARRPNVVPQHSILRAAA